MRTQAQQSKRKHSKLLVVFLVLGMLAAGWLGWKIANHQLNPAESTAAGTNSKTSVKKPEPKADQQLQTIVDTWSNAQTVNTSVLVAELNGSLRTASKNATVSMVPASTYKVFVAYAVLHDIEAGKYTLSTQTRTGQNIGQCIEQMIVDSNNECGKALGFLLGWQQINSFLAVQGFTHTDLNNYVGASEDPVVDKHTTAQDEAKLLTGLFNGSLMNAEHTKLVIDLMKRQIWHERIVAGVPANIAVASKPGWLTNVQDDMAIVYGPTSTYLLVIMTSGSKTKPLADLSKQIYTYLQTESITP